MDESVVYSSLEELQQSVKGKCTACCPGDCKSFHCPLCPKSQFKPNKLCKIKTHLESHWKTRVQIDTGKQSMF